jgi:hypothetical protein
LLVMVVAVAVVALLEPVMEHGVAVVEVGTAVPED